LVSKGFAAIAGIGRAPHEIGAAEAGRRGAAIGGLLRGIMTSLALRPIR
jgi:hypothetical protein